MQIKASKHRPRIVIVGAGFGGLWAARRLARFPVDVILIDKNNYHTFFPILYQIAAAEVEPEEIVYPVRSIVRKLPGVRFIMAEVEQVNLAGRSLKAGGIEIPYDYLVLAIGSVSNFFGVPGAEEYAFPLKTMEEGISLRNHILCCFERAFMEPDAARRRQELTFTIVGGGPTGLEFAGALSELIRGPLKKDYPGIDFSEARVVLVEAKDSILPELPEQLRTYALERLRRMGVEVRLGAAVSRVSAAAVDFSDGSVIRTETVVWTSGVRADPAIRSWGLPQAAGGRVAVLPTLQSPDHPNVYVVGDLAYCEQNGRALPMIAPVAIQQGEAAAKNIAEQIAGRDPAPFLYRERGIMVTIGRNGGAAFLFGRPFTGFPAWLIWLFVHITNLIGFRNRLFVLIDWAWDYFFFERAVRLILPSERNCDPPG